MKTNHIKKVKPMKSVAGVDTKTRDTGVACIPSGEHPVSAL
jgi:hypothetical protein